MASLRLLVRLAILTCLAAAICVVPVSGGVTTRVSSSSTDEQGNYLSGAGSISADGRYVAFESAASNLVTGDTNGYWDVFVRDRQTGQTERVSVSTSGTQGNRHSSNPSISGDGRYVVFQSSASNLVSGDTNGSRDVYVRDRHTGQTTCVSVSSSGQTANSTSEGPSISSDGRCVAFRSWASNLVPGGTNGNGQILVHDRQTGQTTCVSVSSSGEQGNDYSYASSISADGRYVAFESAASNLVPGDTYRTGDIFVHDRQTGQTTCVSVSSSGEQANSESEKPSISSDGRYVAFCSWATNLVPGGTKGYRNVFVHDRQTGQTACVSVSSSDEQAHSGSMGVALSADGMHVAFSSNARDLVSGDTNEAYDVFVHNRQTGQTERVSVSSSGAQANGTQSTWPSISADGRYVAFQSDASNLVSGDTNGVYDVFIRERLTVVLTLTPTSVEIGQPLTATAYCPGASSVWLSSEGIASGFPDLTMSPSGTSTFALSFPTSFLVFARGSTVKFTARATDSNGATGSGSAVLRIRDIDEPPPNSLYLDTDDTNTFGLADSTYEPQIQTPERLEAKLLMTHDLNLWFHLQTSASGGAVAEAPTGTSIAEIMGRWGMANPHGTIAWRGVFSAPDQSVTMRLCFDGYGGMATIAEIILQVVPGGSGVSPASLAAVIPDLQGVAAIYKAGQAFNPVPNTGWRWTKAVTKAVWELRGLATDKVQRKALQTVLARLGISVSDATLKDAFVALSIYDVLKIIGSEGLFLIQAKGDDIVSTFTSHRAADGAMGIAESPVAAATAYRPATAAANDPGAISVVANIVPSVSDWLISYSVTDGGNADIWSWTVFYNRESGPPSQITAPSGWSYHLDSEQGAITWFTQEYDNGWVSGDFGPNAIPAGGTLAGFSIRHTAPPGYTLCSSIDAAYAPSYGETLAPGGTGSVSEAKGRFDSMPKVIADRTVSAVLSDRFYVTDPKRSCGICVTGCGTTVQQGDVVRVAGAGIETDGEVAIQAWEVVVASHTGEPAPAGISVQSLGGGPFGLQEGITNAFGLNNIGLLIKTFGRVTEIEQVQPPALPTWFKIDDGSGVNVKCVVPSGMTIDPSWRYVVVTGISSCERVGEELHRLVRVRGQEDVVPVLGS